MSVRPRNSPNLQECEIGYANNINDENENDEKIEETENKQSKLKTIGFYALAAALLVGIMGLAYYLGTLNGNSSQKSSAGKMVLKMHWTGEKEVLNKYGDKDGDACVLLGDCFKSFAPDYHKSTSNPYKSCHEYLKDTLRRFDSGFYYEGSRLVGFISAEVSDKEAAYGKMLIYNVCIRKEDRGKRVGKHMVPEFIKTVAEKRFDKTKPKVYVGLDVDFESDTAISAFALYAKMGFIRWWQFDRVYLLDFKILEDQEAKAKAVTDPVYEFPLAKFMLGGKDYIQKQVVNGKGKRFTHMSMVMLMGKDDFGDIGKDIKEAVKGGI